MLDRSAAGAVCQECGAVIKDGRSCQEIFEEFLALEFSEPDFGEVHFLTVACFMVQHRRYSDAALKWIERELRDFLENKLSGEDIRRRAKIDLSRMGRARNAILRSDGSSPVQVDWSKRITDVVFPEGDANRYRAEIFALALSTLEGMQVWMPPSDRNQGIERKNSRRTP